MKIIPIRIMLITVGFEFVFVNYKIFQQCKTVNKTFVAFNLAVGKQMAFIAGTTTVLNAVR